MNKEDKALFGDAPPSPSQSVLIVDPQVEGHHLTWIRYITDAFLSQNFKVTLMADFRPQHASKIHNVLQDRLKDIQRICAFNENGRYHGNSCLKSVSLAQKEYGFSHIFFNELDLFASNCLRQAAMGRYPPRNIKGLLSGIYFRPRFLFEKKTLSNSIKSAGFKRLYQNRWFKNIFLMDEQRIEDVSKKFPDINFNFLPDPWDGNFAIDQKDARSCLNLPPNKFIVLQFGIGTKRKGLHHVANAMKNLPDSSDVFLLCAGKLSIPSKFERLLYKLEAQGKAKILNRYVSDTEEKFCFCASDAVLLPYVHHMGSSGVLSRACAAGKPVIASDFDLVGFRVKQYELGLVFEHGSVAQLKTAIHKLAQMDIIQKEKFKKNNWGYAKRCHYKKFKQAVTKPFVIRPIY